MALYLSHADVSKVIRMEDVFRAVDQAFQEYGAGTAVNMPRQHIRAPVAIYRSMSGSVPGLDGMGTKVGLHSSEVTAGSQVARGDHSHTVTTLYSAKTGELRAIIWSGLITDFRTGAMAGVSAKYLARADATTLGLLGSGRQARASLRAVALARRLDRVWVFSPTVEHRGTFAEEMAEELGLQIEAVSHPREAVERADMVVAAANTRVPVFEGGWLREGTHVVSLGGSRRADASYPEERREIDDLTVQRSDLVTLDSLEQAVMQGSPELGQAIERERVVELGAVIAGRAPGRTTDRQITLFKSFGMAIHDVAAAAVVYERAVEQGLGTPLEKPSGGT